MSKKGKNRKEKNNQSNQRWEELEDIYQAMGRGIVDVTTKVNEAIQYMNSVGIEESPELVLTVRSLVRDITEITESSVSIHSTHSGKTGIIKDSDDLALCLDIFNSYVVLNDKFKGLTMGPMLTITEHLTTAIEKAEEADLPKKETADATRH